MTNLIIGLINIYRNYLKFLKLPSCRYYPTCSEYAICCLKEFGLVKASFRILWRTLRCNPFSKGGFDPVEFH